MRFERWIYEMRMRMRALFGREAADRELDDELAYHVAMKTEENVARGMNAAEARRQALIDAGGIELAKENCRETRGVGWIYDLMQDLRFGLRMLRKSPGFTAVAVLTLALGIGANTAIFSFMDSILLRRLPVSDPTSLVTLNWRSAHGFSHEGHCGAGCTYNSNKSGVVADIFPFPVFEAFQRDDALFSSVIAYCGVRDDLSLLIQGHVSTAKGEYVSGDYFGGLGTRPSAGRLIGPNDDRTAAVPVAVVSWGFSQTYFGGAANATGQSIDINGVPVTIAGVATREFFGVDPATAPDIYLPLQKAPALEATNSRGTTSSWYLNTDNYWLQMMARLRPSVSLAQAQAALAPQFDRWEESVRTPENANAALPFLVIGDGARGLQVLRDEYSEPLYVLMTMVGLILAIACANVASLLLARGAARRREMALRICVGAGRIRVARQLLTESVLLASLGGALGVLFAVGGIRFLTLLLANGRADFTLHAELNWHVLGAAMALSLLTGVFFGFAPALQSTKVDVMPTLKEIRSSARRSRGRISLRQALVVSQIALTLPMLVAAGLFVRTLANLQSVQLGFNPEKLLLFQLNARQAGHRDAELISFYGDLQKRFGEIPGVRSATLSASALIGEGTWGSNVTVAGKETNTRFLSVGPDYFATMQIPIAAGRAIDDGDQSGSQAVAIVNEAFVKANFGKTNPLGQHITFGRQQQVPDDLEIVGVSKDTHYGDLKQAPEPVVYFGYNQRVWDVDGMTYALRTAGDPLAYADTVREIVHQADSRIPLVKVRTQSAQIDQAMSQENTFAKLCTAFAILALLIACVGLYGTMSYDMARRTGEIGIRIALGAQRGDILRAALSKGFLLVAVGTAIGLCASLALTRLVASEIWGVSENDPRTFVAVIGVIASVGLAACWIPARRAMRVAPMVALRHE